jgi:signal transduction histidine kinase
MSERTALQALLPETDDDLSIVIATAPATARQRKTALGVAILLIVVAVCIAPFAATQVARIDVFVPVLQTVLSVADIITATLLFSQYSIQPQRSLLALASGYVCSSAFAFLQTLSFPGAYAPGGLIGDQFNTPGWFFVFWQTIFPLSVLTYALLKRTDGAAVQPTASTAGAIRIAVGCVLVAIVALTWLATAGARYLPSLYTADVILQTRFANRINVALWVWGVVALAVLFVHRRTILDLWLMVTLVAWMPNFLVAAVASSVRFSIGWYAARGFALIASCMLLTVLLTEMTFLYSRLANALTLQRRERNNRFMSVEAATAAMAHELRTPLAAIALNASTARSLLSATPYSKDELDTILEDIESTSHRAGSIISSIRELSAKAPVDRDVMTSVDVVARQVLQMVQDDLKINDVAVKTAFNDDLPQVRLDPTQLQQVLLNLVKNAIDAMGSIAAGARVLRLVSSFDGKAVVLSVQDSGMGIAAKDRDRIFDPFFTTKPAGMGLGLAICRTVVENHGGKLRLSRSDSSGSIFEIAIPVDA